MILFYGRAGLVSMGGPHSNHLFSLAGLCRELGIPLTVLIRESYPGQESYILDILQDWGVAIVRLPSEAYAPWRDKGYELCAEKFPGAVWIPEGGSIAGTNDAFEKIATEMYGQGLTADDWLVLPAGTGGTFAGLFPWLDVKQKVLLINAVPGYPLKRALEERLGNELPDHIGIAETGDYGRFGKLRLELYNFAQEWQNQFGIPLDPVYTTRMFYSLWSALRSGEFSEGTQFFCLHTGGHAGARSWERLNGKLFTPVGIRPDIG